MNISVTKKIFISLTAVLLCVMLSTSAFANKLGDVDGDGKILSSDARMALRAAVGLEKLDAEQQKAADVDGGGIKAADARLILRAAVGLEKLHEHSYNTKAITKKATCAEPGEVQYVCSCGEVGRTDKIPATGEHTKVIRSTVDATCAGADGYKEWKCSVCGKTGKDIIPGGHLYTVEHATITQSKKCTRCGLVKEKAFNDYVNSIKKNAHTISYLEKSTSTSKFINENLKFSTGFKALLLLQGMTEKQLKEELIGSLNSTETNNSLFYKNRELTLNRFPLTGSELVSELEDRDVVSYTIEKVKAVDFRDILADTYTSSSEITYDTSKYNYKEIDNLIKLTVVINEENYSSIKGSDKKTALMKIADLDIRSFANEMVDFDTSGMEGSTATLECKEAKSNATVIFYIDTANNDAPVAAYYDIDVICDPSLVMDFSFDNEKLLSGSIDFCISTTTDNIYFFDNYFD